MESMSSSIEPVVPRTANLLACKQWWRVCFLYGDQQKYYRQVYSKAAAQRLALSAAKASGTATDLTSELGSENDNGNKFETEYDTVAIDYIDTQLDEDAEDPAADNITTTMTLTNIINTTTSATKDHRAPVALFPSNTEGHSSTSNNKSGSTLRKSKRLLRSLRGHRKGGGDTNDDTCINRNTNDNDSISNNSQKTLATKHLRDTLETLKHLSINIQQKPFEKATNEGHMSSEPTQQNAKHTILDDPFLFGINEDHLGDLIRGNRHDCTDTPIISDHVSKYFNLYLDGDQDHQHSSDTQSMLVDDVEEEKPALPPKRQSVRKSPPPILKLSQNDLEFLNLNLRNRSLPRDIRACKDPHDISFTFKEVDDDSKSISGSVYKQAEHDKE